jgi:plastocyanin
MRPSRLFVASAALVVSAGLLAACGNTRSASSAPTTSTSGVSAPTVGTGTTITIKNFAFSPSTLTVAAGARVTVHNDDSATHTVRAVSGAFNTGDVGPGGTVTFTAPTTAGSYPYICMIHQFMQATLIVS